MIRITIDGTVGIRVGGRLAPKTKADGAFSTDPETEAALVAEGVAEYADPDADKDDKPREVKLERLRKPELLAMAAERGLYDGDPDAITAKKLIALLKSPDNPPSDGQKGDDSTQNTENGQTPATGDESGQSGENGPDGTENGQKTDENDPDGSENAENGGVGDGSVSGEDPASTPPVIDAPGVVE